MRTYLTAAMAATFLAGAVSAESVKIGFVTTLTTGAAVIGNDMKNSVELAVEHLGGRMMSILSPAISGRMCCWPRANRCWMPASS